MLSGAKHTRERYSKKQGTNARTINYSPLKYSAANSTKLFASSPGTSPSSPLEERSSTTAKSFASSPFSPAPTAVNRVYSRYPQPDFGEPEQVAQPEPKLEALSETKLLLRAMSEESRVAAEEDQVRQLDKHREAKLAYRAAQHRSRLTDSGAKEEEKEVAVYALASAAPLLLSEGSPPQRARMRSDPLPASPSMARRSPTRPRASPELHLRAPRLSSPERAATHIQRQLGEIAHMRSVHGARHIAPVDATSVGPEAARAERTEWLVAKHKPQAHGRLQGLMPQSPPRRRLGGM